MKRFSPFILLFLFSGSLLSQVPQSLKYQAVARDASGNFMAEEEVNFQISILQGNTSGESIYIEQHSETTNQFGLVNLTIGNGSVLKGDFTTIDWGNDTYFLKVELNGIHMGTSQMLSVPYALHAGSSDTAIHYQEADPVFSASGWSITGNAGTDTSVHFIGTTDDQPLVFRVNDTERMRLNTTGNLAFSGTGSSLFIGEGAGMHDDLSDNWNIFIGDSTGHMNTKGHHNTACGHSALYSNTTGGYNTGFGYKALYSYESGYCNTAVGAEVLSVNTSGSYNTGLGTFALKNNTTGTNNTATGLYCLTFNSTGSYNTASGYYAMYDNHSGAHNTVSGTFALRYNNGGSGNVVMGHAAMYYNTTGHSNVALGARTLTRNTDRSNLVAVGDSALYHNGSEATADFHSAYNTAVGSKSLFSNTTGFNNTSHGFQTLYSNTTGAYNTACGYKTLYTNTTGEMNTGLGNYALTNNLEGRRNTANGCDALGSNTLGSYNTAHGMYALYYNITGDYNTAVGYSAGPSSTSSDNLVNTGAFGYNARVSASNTIRIGNSSIAQIGGYAAWSNLSDGRFKTSITQNVPGLEFIMKLKPVTFHWDLYALEAFQGTDGENKQNSKMEKARIEKEKKIYTGFIAQEVEKAATECGYDFSAIIRPTTPESTYHLSYAEFVVPLVKAIQEQQKQIEKQQQQIEQLMREIQ